MSLLSHAHLSRCISKGKRMSNESQITEHIEWAVGTLLKKGWSLPIHFSAHGVGGSVIAGTYTHDGKSNFSTTINAQYLADGKDLVLPVNIMFVTANGEEAVRVTIGPAMGAEGPV